MNKIKDFFYNINDIVIALIIIGLAALLIMSRINAVMDYPTTHGLVAENGISNSADPAGSSSSGESGEGNIDAIGNGSGENAEGGNGGEAGGQDNGSTGNAGSGQYPFSVYISYGQTVAEIGQIMVDLGLFTSVDEFMSAVDTAGAATKLQTGTFIIPQDASHDEVISIITKPGL